jgi:RNA polymerase sigma factor (sigma-70 family)
MSSSAINSEHTQLMEALAAVSTDKVFIAKCQHAIGKILSPFIYGQDSELSQITQDAISESVVKTYDNIVSDNPDIGLPVSALQSLGTQECGITRYLFASVKNYALTRVKRWGKDKKTNKPASRSRVYRGLDVTEEDWFQQIVSSQQGDVEADNELDAIDVKALLAELGIKPDVIDIMLLHKGGHTYKDIAAQYDLSEDAVRKRIKRAVKEIADKLSCQSKG